MRKLHHFISLVFLSVSLLNAVNAMSLQTFTAIGGGPLFLTDFGTSTQNFPIKDPREDESYTYYTQTSSKTAGFFDLFLGIEQPLLFLPLEAAFIQYGFNYHQPSVLSVTGQFTQGLDVQSANTYHFHYQVIPHQLLAQAKLLKKLKYNVYPYLFGGIGGSINSASQYSTNVPPFITFTRQYQNNRSGSLSYTAGLGIDWEIQPTWRLGAAWRLDDFGRTQLGSASINNNPVSGSLSLANLYANEILFQFTKLW